MIRAIVMVCVLMCACCNTPSLVNKSQETSELKVEEPPKESPYRQYKEGGSHSPQILYQPEFPTLPKEPIKPFTPETFAEAFIRELEFRLMRESFVLKKPLGEAMREDMSKPLYAFFRKLRREVERNDPDYLSFRDADPRQNFGDLIQLLRRAVTAFLSELSQNAARGSLKSLGAWGELDAWFTFDSIVTSLTAVSALAIASITDNFKFRARFRLGHFAYAPSKIGTFTSWLMGLNVAERKSVAPSLVEVLNRFEFEFEADDVFSSPQVRAELNYSITDSLSIGVFGRYNESPDDESEIFSVRDIYDASDYVGGIQLEFSPKPRTRK